MHQTKQRKEVGFIRSSSNKKLNSIEREPEDISSDSFSSFQYEQKSSDQEFSPFKHPKSIGTKQIKTIAPTFGKNLTVKNESKDKKIYAPTEFTNARLKGNFSKSSQVSNKQDEAQIEFQHIKKICKSIEDSHVERMTSYKQNKSTRQNYERDLHQKSKNNYFAEDKISEKNDDDEEVSDQNPHFQQSNQSNNKGYNNQEFGKNSKDHLNMEYNLKHSKNVPVKKYPYEFSSQSNSQNLEHSQQEISEQSTNQKHFSNKPKISTRLIQKETRQNVGKIFEQKQNEEGLITEYNKKQFIEKGIKKAILNQKETKPLQKVKSSEGFYQTKGGVCFDYDVREFNRNKLTDVPSYRQPQRKKLNPNSKQEILRRRQTARAYDRQTRHKIFNN